MNNCFCHLNGYEVKDAKARVCETLQTLKIKKNLKVGDVITTKGYYDVNDGGHGTYLIRNKLSDEVEDGGRVIFLNDGHVAELMGKGVNSKQYGAMGDGADSTSNLKALMKNHEVTILDGDYIINDTLDVIPDQIIFIKDARIVSSNEDTRFSIFNIQNTQNVVIKGYNAYVDFTETRDSQIAISLLNARNVRISGLNIYKAGIGIDVMDSQRVIITENIIDLDNDLGILTKAINEGDTSGDVEVFANIMYQVIEDSGESGDDDLDLNPDTPTE